MRLSNRSYWSLLALAALLAFGLRWIAVAEYESGHPLADRPVIDERSYDRWARDIAGGEWLGHEIFFQEPLYPYALGVVYRIAGDDPTAQRHAARVVQVGLGALSVLLAAWLASRLFGRASSLIAAFALAVYRPAIWFATLLLKENLFVPELLVVALLLHWALNSGVVRRTRLAWLALGVAVGVGALLRGNLLVLAPCFVAWPIVRTLAARTSLRNAFASAGLAALGVALALAPVAIRNHAVGGRYVLSTSGAGTNFYGGNNLDNPFGVAKEFDWVRGIPEHEADDWRHEAERRLARKLDPSETSSFWLGEALRSIGEHPWFHVVALWHKARLTLGTYEVPDNHFLEWDAKYVAILRAPFPGFAWWGSFGLAGLLLTLFFRRGANAFGANGTLDVALIAFAYLATVIVTVTSDRVRLPLVPFLCVFAAGWIVRVATTRRAIDFLPLALALVFVLVPTYPREQEALDLDERDFDLAAEILADGGDLERASAIASELVHRHPGTPRAISLAADLDQRRARAELARTDISEKDRDRARNVIVDVLERLDSCEPHCNPKERFQIQFLRGSIFQWLGNFESAERDYRAAAEFDPEDPDLSRRLAVTIANRAMEQDFTGDRATALGEALEILTALAKAKRDDDLDRLISDIGRQRDALRR